MTCRKAVKITDILQLASDPLGVGIPVLLTFAHWRGKTKRRQKPLPDEVLIPVLTSLIGERKGFDYFDCSWFLSRAFYTFARGLSLIHWHRGISMLLFGSPPVLSHIMHAEFIFFLGSCPRADRYKPDCHSPPLSVQSHYALGRACTQIRFL